MEDYEDNHSVREPAVKRARLLLSLLYETLFCNHLFDTFNKRVTNVINNATMYVLKWHCSRRVFVVEGVC